MHSFIVAPPCLKRGFTLIELAVAIAALAILTILAMQNVRHGGQARVEPPSAVDRALAKLQWQQLSFSAPDKMELGSTGSVELAIGGGKSQSELAELLDSAAKRDGQKVRIADRMEAHLSSESFHITATTPDEQVVSTKEVTMWKWRIKAIELGSHTLSLSLNALLTIDGKNSTKSVKTFSKDISVQVTSMPGVWAFVDTYRVYVGGFFTVVLIPLFVYFLKGRKSKKNTSDET